MVSKGEELLLLLEIALVLPLLLPLEVSRTSIGAGPFSPCAMPASTLSVAALDRDTKGFEMPDGEEADVEE